MAGKTKKLSITKKSTTPKYRQDAETLAVADVTLRPSANAAAVIAEYAKPFGEQSVNDLMNLLRPAIDSVSGGDMKRCEAMLTGQAHALQAIFTNFSRRAINQEYMKTCEIYLRLALKAQNQCRMTLETLATIKNPPVVFAKQANIANGPQQVNNGNSQNQPHDAHAREEKTIQPNELLTDEVQDGATLDDGRTSATSSADKELATVGEINRPANG